MGGGAGGWKGEVGEGESLNRLNVAKAVFDLLSRRIYQITNKDFLCFCFVFVFVAFFFLATDRH